MARSELDSVLQKGWVKCGEEGSGFGECGGLVVGWEEEWADYISDGGHVLAQEGYGALVFVIRGRAG